MSNKNVELMRGEPEIAVRKLAIPIMISMLLTASYRTWSGSYCRYWFCNTDFHDFKRF